MGCLSLTYKVDAGDLRVDGRLDCGDLQLNARVDAGDLRVTATLVCEVSIGENGEEMWWCGNWRVKWNNGLPTLWRRS